MDNVISIDGKKFTVTRKKLRDWLYLENIGNKLNKAIETKSRDEIVSGISAFVSIALSVDKNELEVVPWYEIADAYISIYNTNAPTIEFPILTSEKSNIFEAWDYDERAWYLWANILASTYGWSLEYIADLDIDNAIGLIQEIFVAEQLEREWEWGLSEIAYPYDKNSKQYKFNPLRRPSWMSLSIKRVMETPTKIRMKKSMLPVGNIIKLSDDGSTNTDA